MGFDCKKGRLVILGFDGMDYDLTETLIQSGDLPNLKKLRKEGSSTPFKSVFPPDSIPSWITAFTGKNPAEHGVLDHVNYLIKGEDTAKIDTSIFHGNTFWDKISDLGHEVCVVNPFMAYPVWPVNGVMVSGPVFIDGDIEVSNPDYVGDIPVPDSIGGIVDLPSKKNIEKFFHSTVSDTVQQAEFGTKLFQEKSPRLFFQTFLTTDRIQHHLWRYTDENDPTYPGDGIMKDSIRKFFITIDDIIGQYKDLLNANDLLLIISDHGHGMRCTHTLNLNEFFRKEGLLYFGDRSAPKLHTIIIEKTKNAVLSFMRKNDLEDYMHVVARFVPNAKALKKGEHLTKSNNTLVKASSFAGVNPFGGVEIDEANTSDYESLRDLVIDKLGSIEFQGKPVFKWVKRREEIYMGKNIEKYPSLLFEMVPELGTGMSMYSGLFSENPTHKKVSGGHKQYGVFMTNRGDISIDPKECAMDNFYSSILSLLDISEGSSSSRSFIVNGR